MVNRPPFTETSRNGVHPEGGPAKPEWPDAEPIADLSGVGESADWIVHGLVARGHMTLFTAAAKAGKTTLISHLIRSISDGTSFAGLATSQCRTLIVSEESPTLWSIRRDHLSLKDVFLLC